MSECIREEALRRVPPQGSRRMASCYEEGEKLFNVAKLADELQQLWTGAPYKGIPVKPERGPIIKTKINELKEAIAKAQPHLMKTEKARIETALKIMDDDMVAATEEIIRTVQLPMTVALFRCVEERRK